VQVRPRILTRAALSCLHRAKSPGLAVDASSKGCGAAGTPERPTPGSDVGAHVVSSQKTLVLAALRTAGSRGICIGDLPLNLGYSARNRIGTLRREGFDIKSELCRVHAHDGPISRYYILESRNVVQVQDARPSVASAAREMAISDRPLTGISSERAASQTGAYDGAAPVIPATFAQEVLAL
jgi:hypothetical protein